MYGHVPSSPLSATPHYSPFGLTKSLHINSSIHVMHCNHDIQWYRIMQMYNILCKIKKTTGAGTYKMVNCLSSGNQELYASFLSGSAALKTGTHFYICGR